MKIDFGKIEEKAMPNFNGGDNVVYMKAYADESVKILWLRIPKGASVGMHTHVNNSEIEYVLQGTAKFVIDGRTEIVEAGNSHYCPRGCSHLLANESDEDLLVFATVPELK